MKELTIEQKAKAYDSLFERLKEMYNNNKTNVFHKVIFERYFPELKESENERIREFLIHEVTETSDEVMSYRNMNKKDVLAWLEKQGEQKPVWSENDKKMLNQIISIIEDADDNLVRPENISIYINWLKSKTQSQLKWKPSELQIEALESATANCAYSEYEDCLKELIKKLKQL